MFYKSWIPGLKSIATSRLEAGECIDLLESSAIALLSKCKPMKDPNSQDIHELNNWLCNMKASAAHSLSADRTSSATVARMVASVEQMSEFQIIADSVYKHKIQNRGAVDLVVPCTCCASCSTLVWRMATGCSEGCVFDCVLALAISLNVLRRPLASSERAIVMLTLM